MRGMSMVVDTKDIFQEFPSLARFVSRFSN